MRRRQTLAREIEQRLNDGRYVIHQSAQGWSDPILPCCGNPAADMPPWDRMAKVREFNFAATCPRLVGAGSTEPVRGAHDDGGTRGRSEAADGSGARGDGDEGRLGA